MAIDTPARHIYSGDGSTRVFPIPTYIQGDDYIRIEINGVHQIDRSKWDIVNNSIIFVTAPITTATIDVQVATSVEALSELGNVTNVDIVAGNIASINGIASNLDEILEADNNAVIATTKANEASASALIATTKAGEALASSTSALASSTSATSKASEASISATTAITKASEASISATTAITKASEALSSATSASSSAITASSGATTATTKAGEASTSASNALTSENKAKKWADESEDVPVESGLYSAKHWASKAAEIVGAGLIDDVTPSTSTVFSSTRSNNTYEPKNSNIQGHISNNTTNPHNVTKSQIGLSNVDNTSDANKPISNATSTALNSKQDTLVSGTNIKTINGSSVLGSGDVVVGGINLSNITAYHLLQGNLAVSNSTITQGFNTTLYTGSGTAQSINTGVDMTTQWGNDASEKFGGLVWIKNRDTAAYNNLLFDSIRGATNYVITNSTIAQANSNAMLTSFVVDGFGLGGYTEVNGSSKTYASWNFQTTHRRTGTTNHGKAYTEHYNPYTGFTIIKYEGSGTAGHEIPHSLGRKLGMAHFKNLTTAQDWLSYYGVDNMYMALNLTIAGTVGVFWSSNETTFNFNSDTGLQYNQSGSEHIMYGWANSYLDENNTLIGNYEIGVYQGTGAAGNKVTTRGKPAWVMIKRLDAVGEWVVMNNIISNFDAYLTLNTAVAEIAVDIFNVSTDGFTLTGVNANASGGQYLYMVVYDNDSGSGKSKYPKATDTTNLNINALVPYANGIDVNGSKVSISYKNETISGLTLTQGKNYIYSKNDGTYGVNKYIPMYGALRDRSVAGESPDYFDLAKQKWFSTSAGTELVTNGTFDSNTTGWTSDAGATIASVNGMMTVTSTSSSSGYVSQTITTVVGKTYRLKTYANNISMYQYGLLINDASNTYYTDTVTATGAKGYNVTFIAQTTSVNIKIYRNSSAASQVVNVDNVTMFEVTPTIGSEITPRTYLDCIVYADHNGQPAYVEELPKTTYFDEIKANDYKGKNACTAWVNFDGTTTPPTIRDSYNVASVVKISAGIYDIYFKTTMDNVNYTLFGTGYSPSDGYSRSIMRRNGTTPLANKITVMHSTGNAGVVLDSAYIDVQITGGKN